MNEEDPVSNYLDLRGIPCPKNFIRCRLALEELSPNQLLEIHIDKGEPEAMVIPGLKTSGYKVDIIDQTATSIRFVVTDCVR